MLTYVLVSAKWEKEMCSLFRELLSRGVYQYFHPHPLTDDEVKRRLQYKGKDLYYLQIYDDRLSGYGFLRGWDEGYETPSLGLAIHPDFQRQGLGKKFMFFLHDQALIQGATRVRLTVATINKKAIRLYQQLGYKFHLIDATTYEGFIDIRGAI